MKRIAHVAGLVGWLGVVLGGPCLAGELEQYVHRDDPTFSWSAKSVHKTPGGLVTDLDLVSQTWQDIRWEHRLRVHEAAKPVYPDAMLLFITGGSSDSKPGAGDEAMGLALSRLCGTRVAVLHQVPNQPLLGGKKEDTLIAETFVRYLETKDADWPLLFPMVKSAVRAMDALQAWAKEQGVPVPSKFVVAGASKRGWTTWLTGAVDRRVVGIAPMVIDTLNMPAQKEHYMEVWGKPSEQIGDYTGRGLDNSMNTPTGRLLWKMVDPYTYRDRLTLPKQIINGTNDPYWTLDALNVYWDDLKGPKSVVYLPNAGHNLGEHRDYALSAVGALARHAITGRPYPKLSWTHSDGDDGTLRLSVAANPPARSARAWIARAETRDFRQVRWEESPLAEGEKTYQIELDRPEKGFIALFGDLEFEVDGVAYHLSTQIRQAGARAEDKR